jgi:hypothetical protein
MWRFKKSDTRPFKAGCRRLGVATHQPMAERSWVRLDHRQECLCHMGLGLGLGLGLPRVTHG